MTTNSVATSLRKDPTKQKARCGDSVATVISTGIFAKKGQKSMMARAAAVAVRRGQLGATVSALAPTLPLSFGSKPDGSILGSLIFLPFYYETIETAFCRSIDHNDRGFSFYLHLSR